MAINLRGVWSCMKFELQQMREQGSGAIVNCSSLGGLIGGNQRGTYHAAKHGVIGFTKSAALEYRNSWHSRQRHMPGHDPDAHVRQDDCRRPGRSVERDVEDPGADGTDGAARRNRRCCPVALQFGRHPMSPASRSRSTAATSCASRPR